MNTLILDAHNRPQLRQWLASDSFVVACLCAAWCDTCTAFMGKFDELAALHPNQRFVWIDIEDQADLVGDLDISNFPTLLIQRQDMVAFFGTIRPDMSLADRLLRAQLDKSHAELASEARTGEERIRWQLDYNLRSRLENN
ncbi:MAG TPA: thioredoxin family protein [Burkholderiaceae bacterium]|jgi:thioredoxin 1|nr:thioredoxin family protein [Burkholderiaceae bacterium]